MRGPSSDILIGGDIAVRLLSLQSGKVASFHHRRAKEIRIGPKSNWQRARISAS
jgi:hypothetical protein